MSSKSAWVLILFGAAAAMVSSAQTFTTLVNFDRTNGRSASSSLVQANGGSLYGETRAGAGSHYGTIFKITPAGVLTSVYSFNGAGIDPLGGLVQATNGDLYGTTANWGNYSCVFLCGSIFKITPAGALTTLHAFNVSDGGIPQGALIQASNGELYGTTSQGGATNPGRYPAGGNGCGTIFKMTPEGNFTTLHSFDETDGASPQAGLVQATDSNLYGTTFYGGTNDVGTVFKITPDGVFTTLHSFDPDADGAGYPSGLVQGTDGDLYGTTQAFGLGYGTVFKITTAGALTILYSFHSTDGAVPLAGLIQATDGNFYGTTSKGADMSNPSVCGPVGCGTVFEMSPSGALTTLHSFEGTDGAGPIAVVQDTNGSLYGTTSQGGAACVQDGGCGTVFRLSVGLNHFVKTLPVSAAADAGVIILGTNLTGATSVTFNGTPAAFTVVSPVKITTRVPTGATTGNLQVITPRGTLVSNVPFLVQ